MADFKAKMCAERAARASKRKGETWVAIPTPPPVKIVKPKTDYDKFEEIILKKAPKLIVYKAAIGLLFGMSHIRNVQDWEPEGKGAERVFISLASFLVAKFNMPKFIWSIFFAGDPHSHSYNAKTRTYINRLVDFLYLVASGESVYKICQAGVIPIPLTRKQCHDLMSTTSNYNFMTALRKVQIQTYGGSPRLLDAWMNTRYGQNLCSTKEQEVFWDSVIAWFAKNPMLDLKQVGPITDYLAFLYNQNNDFSMKGRSVLAVMRGMEEWHGELNRAKNFKAKNFEPSGFLTGVFQNKTISGEVKEQWTVEEILTSAELAAEGKAMSHCVYSYAHTIVSGDTSIWSMRYNNERLVTIEVWNKSKQIRQVRGKYNRMADSSEMIILQKWAGMNNLSINTYRW